MRGYCEKHHNLLSVFSCSVSSHKIGQNIIRPSFSPRTVLTRVSNVSGSHAHMSNNVSRCANFQGGGTPKPIDECFLGDFECARNEYASSGQRVLAFAMLPLAGDVFPLGFQFSEESIAGYAEDKLVRTIAPPHTKALRPGG